MALTVVPGSPIPAFLSFHKNNLVRCQLRRGILTGPRASRLVINFPLRSKPSNERCPNVLGRFIQQPIVQTEPERQRLGPSSHILDKRLPVPETRPNLVPQEERGNASSFARRAHLHRNRAISYNAPTSREVCWDDTSWLGAESIRRLQNPHYAQNPSMSAIAE